MTASQRPVAEQLETRQMMSATAALADGVLTVTGTEKSDAIIISLDPADSSQLRVKSGRETSTFNLASITSVSVNTGDGNDRIVISEKYGRIFLPFKIDAGTGNDVIIAGSGNDVIVAGAGKDKVNGGAGDDQIDGGDGNDKLTGGDDNDLILAGEGKDKIAGGTGDDNLDGGDGRDAITTGEGHDEVAVNDHNTRELKDRRIDRTEDGQYRLTDLSTLSADLQTLHEQVVPGSHVSRVEVEGNTVSMYYRFGDDPQVYKTVVDVGGAEVELVSREISSNEVRAAARGAFAQRFPGAEVVSVFQHAHGRDDIRYRDADGTLRVVTTEDLIWTLDDAEQDADNDGISDQHGTGPDDQGGQDGNGNHDGQDNHETP